MPDLETCCTELADESSVSASTLSPRVHCPNCTADLTFLPSAARYCHRCGSMLSSRSRAASADSWASASARRRSQRRSALRPPQWLSNLWCACTDSDDQDFPFAGRSEVLLAYGKSMFNLGWRYEHAIGARRNLNEAARCYWKAARLGDPSAVGRLGREGVISGADASADPTGPPELPPPAPSPVPAPISASPSELT